MPLPSAGSTRWSSPEASANTRRPCAHASATGSASSASELDESRNVADADVISTDVSRVTVRVIATDEELMIAGSVCRLLGIGPSAKEREV